MKKAIVFGTGSFFEQYYPVINAQYDILYVTDNNCENWEKKFFDKICIPPQKIFEIKFEVLIIAVFWKEYREAIKNQLSKECQGKKIEIIYAEDCKTQDFVEKQITHAIDLNDKFNNRIRIGNAPSMNNLSIYFYGCNNKVLIGDCVRLKHHMEIYMNGNDNLLEIGDYTTIMGVHCKMAEKGIVSIGKDCMISWDVDLFQDPGHPIYDLETGKRTNNSKSIVIGNHVWIGKGAGLLSGFEIGDGSVVGYGSVSSGKFGANVTIAGNPAKVIRENVKWNRGLLDES